MREAPHAAAAAARCRRPRLRPHAPCAAAPPIARRQERSGSNQFLGPAGFTAVGPLVLGASRVSAVKRDSCFAARGVTAALTEIMICGALQPALLAQGIHIVTK